MKTLRKIIPVLLVLLVSLACTSVSQANIIEDIFGEPAAPTITSDKEDYAPGEVVTLTGANWDSGERIELYVNDESTRTWDMTDTTMADSDGNLFYQFIIPSWFVASYSVQATGESGHVAVHSFTDAGKPPASAISGPGDGLSYNATTFAGCASSGQICGTGTGTGLDLVQVQIKRNSDNRFWTGSTWSTTSTWLTASGTTSWTYSFAASNLTNATNYTITSRASAGASVESAPPSVTFTYDTTAPDTTLSSPPSGTLYNQTSQSFTFSSPDATATFECSLDSGAYTSCTSPASYTGLAAGSHTFQVRAKDPAGNADATPATASWTLVIDSTAPETTISSSPANPSSSTAPSFSFASSETGSTFECKLDAGAYAACTSPRSYTGLAEGSHTFTVRATDAAGNTDASPATYTWTIDTTAPNTTISSAPPSLQNSSSAAVAFSSSETGSTFECRLDAGAWGVCTSPRTYTGLSDGSHTISVRAIDAAGNVDATPASATFTVDTTAPTVSISSGPNAPTASTSASFAFSAEAGATFECQLDSGAWTSCTSPRAYSSLAEGSHTFRVRATDTAGNTGAAATRTWSVDTTPPHATIDSAPAEFTTSTSASFTFSAEAGATFDCRLDGSTWAACTSPVSYTKLAEGSHTFEVRAIDTLGNVDPTPTTNTWTVDRTAPHATITAQPASFSNSTSASFSFVSDETGSTFECRLDARTTDPWTACTSPYSLSSLTQGSHKFEVRAIDRAGNIDASPVVYNWTVDSAAPETTITSSAMSLSNQTAASFAFSSSETGTFQCKLDLGSWTACASPVSYTGLTDGSHTFQVRATDAAGNTDATPASMTWTVDTVAPETSITPVSPDPNPSSTATIVFSSSDVGATFECRLDGGAWSPCTSPKTYTGLADGPHSVEVRAIDAATNVDLTPAIDSWTVDTIAPNTTIDSNPASATSSTSASFTFSSTETPATYECSLDGAAFASCSSPRSYNGLSQGPHTFQVRAKDSVSNTDATPATYTWTVDTTAPDTTLDTKPASLSNTASPSFTFSSTESGSSFECRLDSKPSDPWVTCSSPQSYSALSDGAHKFEVRSIDAAGNTDATPVTYNWTIDTLAPETTINTKPAALQNSTSATVSFSSEASATFECKLDAGPWTLCTSAQVYNGLSDGSHTISVRATDSASNTDATPASVTFTVDTVAPSVSISSGPSGTVTTSSATFAFTSADASATFECKYDGLAWESCSSPKNYTNLPDGAQVFQVRATDAAGNTGAAVTRNWTVDTTPAETTIDTKPSLDTTSTSASFSFSSETGATFQCRLDGGAWAACTSPASYTRLAEGAHTFEVRATDPFGNTDASPATYTWNIDRTNPETTILSEPASPSKSSSATFSFSSSETGSSFECRLDGKGTDPWESCTTPKTYTGLSDGAHTFEVRAIDRAGNTDASPAVYNWTVDTISPDTSITSSAMSLTNQTAASFAFSSTEASATFECKLDAGAWTTCTSPRTYTSLADGSHTFSVRSTDAAGNTDATPSSMTWTVDTVAPDTTVNPVSPDPSASSSATVIFSSNDVGATFECRLDGGTWSPCTSPKIYTGLADGPHSVEVRAVDPATNVDLTPAIDTWTVDTNPPNTLIDTKPAAVTSATSASFTFSATETPATFECKLDGGAWATCTSPRSYSSLADGNHTFQVRAADALGNQDATPASYTWTVDTASPETTISTRPAALTNQTSASFAFSSTEAGATFECRLDSGSWTACTTPKSYTALSEGSHTFRVRATDTAGNTDATPDSYTWEIDTTAPGVSISSKPASLTKSSSATLSFSSADSGATFECKLDTGSWGACTSPRSYTGLSDGSHTFQVRATDAAGNTGTADSASFTVDTVAPTVSISSGPSGTVASSSASFQFSSADSGATFECKYDGLAWESCTSPKSYATLPDGAQVFQVRATDAAGNTGAAVTRNWTIDTTPAETTILSGPSEATTSTGASFSFSSEAGATFECRLDGDAWSSCSSPISYTKLAEGSHTFEVRASDALGNRDATPAIRTWSVDRTDPETTIDTKPSNPTKSTSASLSFSSNEPGATFECRFDVRGNDPWQSCTSPVTYNSLADGAHTLEVRSIDAAGNTDTTPATYTWTIDNQAPETTITSSAMSLTNQTSASFAFTSSESGSSFECRLDSGAWSSCTSPKTYNGLGDGSHTFQVRATDALGNGDSTPASMTWNVDTVAPDTSVNQVSPDPNPSTTATVTFSSTEAGSSFECRLDGGAWTSCTSPKTYTGLADGPHSVEVRAIDQATNVDLSPAIDTWTVDTQAPNTTISSSPEANSSNPDASFSFSSSEGQSTFQCRLNAGTWESCASPRIYSSLADGTYTFDVRARDAAGNQDASPASYTWKVDTVPPELAIQSAPNELINVTATSVAFSSEAEATFECKYNSGGWRACTSPIDFQSMADGDHLVQIRAKDKAGNAKATPKSVAWKVDTAPPETSVISHPSELTNSKSAQIDFMASESGSTFECKVDGGSWEDCTSPLQLSNLTDGDHSLQIRARDKAGNSKVHPSPINWKVDTVAPDLTISAKPDAEINRSDAEISFASEDGALFDCKIGGGPWQDCISPLQLQNLADGDHSVQIRGRDLAGNSKVHPNAISWKVDTTPAETEILEGPESITNASSLPFRFASEDGALFECKLGSGPWEDCSSSATYENLPEGDYTLRVRARDALGNRDQSPAEKNWKIDRTEPRTEIVSAPADETNEEESTLSFQTNEESTSECRLNGSSWELCSSPYEKSALPEGDYTLEIRSLDKAGNRESSPKSKKWTVDRTAPETTLSSGPSGTVSSAEASFDFTSEAGARFECSLNDEDWENCNSGKTYRNLQSGDYLMHVRAVDRAGNWDETPAQRNWSVDVTPPEITFTLAPDSLTPEDSALLSWTSDDTESTTLCKLNNTAFAPCDSSKTYTRLAAGSHTFYVRTTDKLGNTSTKSYTWSVSGDSPGIGSPAEECSSALGGTPSGYKIDGVSLGALAGNYSDPSSGLRVTISSVGSDNTFAYTSSFPVHVLVKGGSGDPEVFPESTSGSDLHPPLNTSTSKEGDYYGISHITFCWNGGDNGGGGNGGGSGGGSGGGNGGGGGSSGGGGKGIGSPAYECQTQFGAGYIGFKLDGVNEKNFDGTYRDAYSGLFLEISNTDPLTHTYNFSSSWPVSVITKGGSGDPELSDPATSGTALHPPLNTSTSKEGDYYGISHVTFCWIPAGKLQVEKHATPASLGQEFSFVWQTSDAAEQPFFLRDSESIEIIPPAGDYNFEEIDLPAGWDLSNITCENDAGGEPWQISESGASVNLEDGDNISCHFYNEAHSSLTIEKETLPDGSSTQFDFQGPDGEEFSLADGQAKTFDLSPGSYDIEELVKEGWSLEDITCSDDDSSPEGGSLSVHLDPAEETTCIFTNKSTSSVTVEKETLPDGDETPFDFTASGDLLDESFSLQDGEVRTFPVEPGSYDFSESLPEGWSVNDISCSNDQSTTDRESAGATAVVSLDEDVVCTFTNQIDSYLTIEKETLPDGSSAQFDFQGPGDEEFSLADGQSKTFVLPLGQYSVEELAQEGWKLEDITCSDDDSTGNTNQSSLTATLDPGEDVTCVFTNKSTSSITVEKETLPDGADDAFDFTASGPLLDESFSLRDGELRTFPVEPGVYSFSEIANPEWDLTNISCSSNRASGDKDNGSVAIDLSLDENVTCTFINDLLAGSLTVQKETLPEGTAGSFDFLLDDESFTIEAGEKKVLPLERGTHKIQEVAKWGWQLEEITCDDPSQDSSTRLNYRDANILVSGGEDITCVFTNRQEQGTITVEKETLPRGSEETFDFSLKSDDAGETDESFQLSDGEKKTFTVTPGDYSLKEIFNEDWKLTALECDDLQSNSSLDLINGTANLALSEGEDIVCRFTNDLQEGAIVIEKKTLPENLPDEFTFQGPDGNPLTLRDGEREVYRLSPGEYSISEEAAAGFDLVALECDDPSEDSSVTLSEMSATLSLTDDEVIECLFTNDQEAGSITIEKKTDPIGAEGTFSFVTNMPGGNFSLDAGEKITRSVDAGVYQVREEEQDGWKSESIECADDGSSANMDKSEATINVAPGEDVTCTFTNNLQEGTLTVSKETTPDGSTKNFPFILEDKTSGETTRFSLQDGKSKTFTLPVGDFLVREADVAGWSTEDVLCSGDSESDPEAGESTLSLADDKHINCTFINTLNQGSIIVDKETNPDGVSKAFDFAIDRTDGGNPLPLSSFQLQDGDRKIISVEPGTYDLKENSTVGWRLQDLECQDTEDNSLVDVDASGANLDVSPGEIVHCLFTNDLLRGSITIRKETDRTTSRKFAFDIERTDGGGDLPISSFQIGQDEEKVIAVDNGTYEISERLHEGWETEGLSCSDPTGDSDTDLLMRKATLTVQDGENIICTYQNRELRGSLTIAKDTLPDGESRAFSFQGPDGRTFELRDGEAKTFDLHQGSYRVSEDTTSDWQLVDVICTDDNSIFENGGAFVSLAGNEDIICTFYNQGPRASITIHKETDTDDEREFNFSSETLPDNFFSLRGGEERTFIVAPGEYDVVEGDALGWKLWDISCTGGHVHSDPSEGVTHIDADDGEDIHCTYQNRKETNPPAPRAEITITKETETDTTRHFNFSANGDDFETDFALGDGESRTFTVDPGEVLIHELDAAGWKLWDIECDSRNVTRSIDTNEVTLSLEDMDKVTCVFKNNREEDVRSGISVVKKLNPTDDPGTFDLRIDGTVYKSGASHDDHTGWRVLEPGIHTISEVASAGSPDLSNYTSRIICRNSEEVIVAQGQGTSLQVNLGVGIRLECEIINTRKGGIKVVKNLSPASDPGRFNLRVNGQVVAPAVGNGGSSTWQPFAAGVTHTVSETAASGTNLSDYNSSILCLDEASGDEVASGDGFSLDVQLEPSQRIICTISNTRKVGQVRITKDLSPANNLGQFNLLIDGSIRANNVGNGGSTGFVTVNTGLHTISETSGTNTLLRDYNSSVVCRNSTGNIIAQGEGTSTNINVSEGARVSCVISNVFINRALKVVKRVVTPDGSDPNADPGRFNLRIQNGSDNILGSEPGVGNGGETSWISLAPGNYTVSETFSSGPGLDAYNSRIVCRNGAGNIIAQGSGTRLEGVNINNQANARVLCEIVNTRKTGTLRLRKELIPANNSGRFNLLLGNGILAPSVGDNGGSGPREINIGNYTISESSIAPATLSEYTTGITCRNAGGSIIYGPTSRTSLAISISDNSNLTCTFTNTLINQPGTTILSGVQFIDTDKDGKPREPGEPALSNWTIYVDLDGNGKLDPGEPYAVTNEDGGYEIPGVPPGSFTVRSMPPEGSQFTCAYPNTCSWEKTIPAPPPGQVGKAKADFGAVRSAAAGMKRGEAESTARSGCSKKNITVRVYGNSVRHVRFKFNGSKKTVSAVDREGYYLFSHPVKKLNGKSYRVRATVEFADGSPSKKLSERVFVCPKIQPQFTG